MDRGIKRKASDSHTKVKKRIAPKQISPALKAYVNSRLAREGETKHWYDYASNQSITSAGAGSYPTARNLAPVLSLGTSQYQRIGNKIKVTSATVRGYVNILPYNAVSNSLSTPVLVKIWVCSAKQLNTILIGSTDINNTFFDVSGASTGFQGSPLDMILFNNPEKWHIWGSRQFEIGATYASSAGPVGTSGYFDNSNMTKQFEIDFTAGFKRSVLYEDATTSPTNLNFFLVFQTVYADGQYSGTNIQTEYHVVTSVEYKDV